MNRIQKNQQIMAGSVSQTAANYNTVWKDSPLFTGTVDNHHENLITVNALEVKQAQAYELKGIVRDKNILRSFIADAASRIVSAIKGFALATNNQQLFTSVAPYTESELAYRLSDIKFLTAITNIITIANANAAGILPFGITDGMITNFAGDITSFDSIAKKPKTLRGQLKVFTSQLKVAVKAMMANLKGNMDNQVRSLYPASDFALAYFNSRKIYNYNESVTGIKGTVTDADNGKALRNVIIELINYPVIGENTLRTTNVAGNYHYKKISLTKATLRIRAIGYTTAEFEVPVTKNKVLDFNIQLMPQPAPVPVPA